MKLIVSILLTALLAFAAGLQLPWFAIAIAAFIVAFAIPQSAGKAWWGGFLGISLIWTLLCVINLYNGGTLMAKQIASVLPLKGNLFLLVLLTTVIGGLIGGLSALTGNYGRKLMSKTK
jgi:hypothetical protein